LAGKKRRPLRLCRPAAEPGVGFSKKERMSSQKKRGNGQDSRGQQAIASGLVDRKKKNGPVGRKKRWGKRRRPKKTKLVPRQKRGKEDRVGANRKDNKKIDRHRKFGGKWLGTGRPGGAAIVANGRKKGVVLGTVANWARHKADALWGDKYKKKCSASRKK